jgi:hypothetical protein
MNAGSSNVVPPHCFLQRKGIELELSGGVPAKVKANGRLFLTSVRICFVPDKPTPGFTALDIPLQVRFSHQMLHFEPEVLCGSWCIINLVL